MVEILGSGMEEQVGTAFAPLLLEAEARDFGELESADSRV
jgi:hypothetical protein